MQLLIDTATDNLVELRNVITLLQGAVTERSLEMPQTEDTNATDARAEAHQHREIDPRTVGFGTTTGYQPCETGASIPPPPSGGSNVMPAPSVPAGTQTFFEVPTPNVSIAAAPANSVTLPATSSVSASVDKSGRVWDERIDSSSKNFTADGFWRKRKNLAAGVYETVLQEITGAVTSPTVFPHANIPPPPNVASQPIPITSTSVIPHPPGAVSMDPSNPGQSGNVPPVPPQGGVRAKTFKELMSKVTTHIQGQRLTTTQVNAAVKETCGLENVQALFAQPMHIPAVSDRIDQILAA